MKRYYIFIALLTLSSLGLIGSQFVNSRDPLSDKIRSEDIVSITSTFDTYASKNKKLPESLSDLQFTTQLRGKLSDYQYSTTAADKYQICTDFKTDTTKGTDRSAISTYISHPDAYFHTKGHACFSQQSYYVTATVAKANTSSAPQTRLSQTTIKKVGDACSQFIISTSTGVFDSSGTDAATKGAYVSYKSYPTAYSKTTGFVCSNVVIADTTGRGMTLSQLKQGDSITVYNDGSFVSKITKN